MEVWQGLALAGVVLGLAGGLWLLQRLLLWATRWRWPGIRFEGKGGFNALQPLGDILDPSARLVKEVREHIREDEDSAGST